MSAAPLFTVAPDIDGWTLAPVAHPDEAGRVDLALGFMRGAEQASLILATSRTAARTFALAVLAATGDGAQRTFDPKVLRAAEPVAAASQVVLPPTSPLDSARAVAVAQGYTGDFCRDCGKPAMRRAGTCLTCAECGSTTGCA